MSHYCPECAAPLSDQASTCPACGASMESQPHVRLAPIGRLSGKLQAVGVVIVAVSAVALVYGAWWGAASIFPGMVLFVAGRLLA